MDMALNSESSQPLGFEGPADNNRPSEHNSSDDNSSDEESPPAGSRGRGRPRLADLADEDEEGEAGSSPQLTGIYSTRVSTVVQEVKSGKFKPLASSDSDVEDEDEEFLPAKKRRKKEAISPTLLILDSDNDGETDGVQIEEEAQTDDLDIVTLSPSPPPTPPTAIILARPGRNRRNKEVTTALRNLEKASHEFHESLAERSLNESVDLVMESPSENRTMMVKVRSTAGVQRFPLKPNDTFEEIFKKMAEQEGVSVDRVFMVHKDDIEVQPYDTPKSIKLHIADILDFHVRQSGQLEESVSEEVLDGSCIKVKVQGKDRHSVLVITIRKTNPLENLMREYASKMELEWTSLKFQFDGEDIDPKATPEDLDMEDDDCIDAIQS
ncbi:NFATC2-interacting protein [Lingula anatina]|uniref:NFATC2-interacting protein n=1 Tax=Lingula anatina TaxID=7574 RepID=A0A2R2ML99_LINAN|nr:NFATC2-interacting protein [Lingula anatina]|eukprot:XP_023930847.1 NFATC2-interacting protein [Lingula anatina]